MSTSELQEPWTEQPDLKPERVAEGIAAPWPAIGEPVLPEWPAVSRLASDGHAVERVRTLATPMTAADYAGCVLREAARAKQNVRVGLEGARVVISVMAPYRNPEPDAIDLKQLDFAAALV